MTFLEELDKLEALLNSMSQEEMARIAPEDADRKIVTRRMKALLAKWDEARDSRPENSIGNDLESADNDDELFSLLEQRFGLTHN
jgi:hypothetical protein